MLRAVLCGLLLVSATIAWADDKKKDTNKDTAISNEAKQVFDKYDLNKDDFLDKAELAKMFRGSSAKPPAEKKKDDAKKDDKKKLLPDEEFLQKWDKNGDEKISRDEFEAAFKDYVQQMEKAQRDAQKQQHQNQMHYPHGGGSMSHYGFPRIR
jgi:hypothetical protein